MQNRKCSNNDCDIIVPFYSKDDKCMSCSFVKAMAQHEKLKVQIRKERLGRKG